MYRQRRRHLAYNAPDTDKGSGTHAGEGRDGDCMGRGRDFLERIYALEDEGDVRSFYDEAAAKYDDILLEEIGYVSPTVCAEAIAPHLPEKSARIIDLGCGTGLAGAALSTLGYTHIDGIDFSNEMLAAARGRGCYTNLAIGDLNARLDVADGAYAAALSVGVLGQHVLPPALDECVRIVEPGGIVCFSVNERAFEGHGFRDKVDALVDDGGVTCLALTKEAYHVKENIEGWVCLLRVEGKQSR